MSKLASEDIVIRQQLAAGMSKAEIARQLNVPVSTLKSYIDGRAGRATRSLRERLRKYDLTVESYTEILVRQRFECAACHEPLALWLTSHVHVDHNHDTGEVCGVLCRFCNTALGQLRDDPERVVLLADYARKTRS